MLTLVSDIGATHTRMCLFDEEHMVYREDEFTSKIHVLSDFVNGFLFRAAQHGYTTHKAVFAVAGPQHAHRIALTHADLVVDVDELRQNTALTDIVLYNDVFALAKALPDALVISVGTGLGVATSSLALEAGHMAFPAQLHQDLHKYLRARYDHKVEYEDVLSGRGWLSIYAFFRETQFPDAPALSSAHELAQQDSECSRMSAKLFTSLLAVFCSELEQLTGVHMVLLSGGVLQKNPHLIPEGLACLKNEEAVLDALSLLDV